MKCVVCVFLLLTTWTAQAMLADGPKLVNEKLLLRGCPDVVLAHGGQKLVYSKYKRTEIPKKNGSGTETGSIDRLWILDIASGDSKHLPVPAVMGSDPLELDNVLRSNVLSPDGEKLLLPSGIDANKDAIFDHRRAKRQWVIYHFGTGKTELVRGLPDGIVWPQFDRTGKGRIVTVVNIGTRTVEVYTRALTDSKKQGIPVSGFPIAICPAADLFAMVRSLGRPPQKSYMRQELALYNMKSGKLFKLPTHDRYAETPIKRAVWSSDGRYLYYTNVKFRGKNESRRESREKRSITHVWDRMAGKEIALIDHASPIGPGPGKSTMVLGKVFDQQPYIPAVPMLHDASTGKLWILMEVAAHKNLEEPLPVHTYFARGKYIVYYRSGREGRGALYLAEIAMPKDRSKGRKK